MVATHLRRAGKLQIDGEVVIHPATDVLGESTRQARAAAHGWLNSGDDRPEPAPRKVRVPTRAVLPEGALQPPRRYKD